MTLTYSVGQLFLKEGSFLFFNKFLNYSQIPLLSFSHLFALSIDMNCFPTTCQVSPLRKIDLFKREYSYMFNIALKNAFWYTLPPQTIIQKTIL